MVLLALRLLFLLLLLLLLLLLILLLLLLRLLLRLLGRLFLTRFDVGLVLRRFVLLLLEAFSLLVALLRLLLTFGARLVELLLEIRLLLVVRSLVGRALRLGLFALTLCLIQRVLAQLVLIRLLVRGALRRFGLALRLIELVLTLLVLERLRALRLVRGPLRCVRLVARALQGGLLVAAARVVGALLFVELQLFLADVRLHHAHRVARLAQTVIHEERVVAVVLRHAIAIVVLRRAPVEHLLTRGKIVLHIGVRCTRCRDRSRSRQARSRRARTDRTAHFHRARDLRAASRGSARHRLLGGLVLREGRNVRHRQQRDGTNRRAGGGPPCSAFARDGPDR